MTYVGEEEAKQGKNIAKGNLEQLKRFLGMLRRGRKPKMAPRRQSSFKLTQRHQHEQKLAPTNPNLAPTQIQAGANKSLI